MNKVKILFLCTGNSCRSQMAEGWAHKLKHDSIEPFSAGTEVHGLNPNAVKVMEECGASIKGQHSKTFQELAAIQFDFVITVCASAHETCPVFPQKTTLVHKDFDDPPQLAKAAESEEEKLDCYRRVRDEIKEFITSLPGYFEQ